MVLLLIMFVRIFQKIRQGKKYKSIEVKEKNIIKWKFFIRIDLGQYTICYRICYIEQFLLKF